MGELDESEVIDSEAFDTEYFDAIKCAQSAAKLDAAKIIEGISSEYVSEYEEDALADVISRVFEGIAEAQNDEVENLWKRKQKARIMKLLNHQRLRVLNLWMQMI